MLGALAVSGYELSPPLLTAGSGWRRGSSQKSQAALTRLSEQTETVLRAFQEQKRRFGRLYAEAKKLGISADELDELANALLVKEQDLATKWRSKIRLLERQIAGANEAEAGWIALAEQMLEATIGWLEAYQNIRIRLLKLASDRRSESEPHSPVFSDAKTATDHLRALVAE